MIKKVEYDLNYRIKGKKFTKRIEVDFVPNQRHEDYSKLQQEIFSVQVKWNNIRMLESEIQLLFDAKPDKYIESINIHKAEIEKLTDDIEQAKTANIVQRRYELIKTILIDNGYSDDADLMSWDFWNNGVEPSVINELLEACIWKDIDKKKIVH